jgi:glycosyltransferase involved in cell wall biosynthesis
METATVNAVRGPAALIGGVAVVLVVRDEARLTLRALLSLAGRQDEFEFHTVLVDDASSDATPAVAAGVTGDFTTLRHELPRGFAACVDAAVAACDQDVVVVVREDLLATAGWLQCLLEPFADPAVGAARPRVLELSGEADDGRCWPALAIRREAFEAVGGLLACARPGQPVRASFTDALSAAGWQITEAPGSLLLAVALEASDAAGMFEL